MKMINFQDPSKFFRIKEELDEILREIGYLLKEIKLLEQETEEFANTARDIGFEVGAKTLSTAIDIASLEKDTKTSDKVAWTGVAIGGAIAFSGWAIGKIKKTVVKAKNNSKKKEIENRKLMAENKLRETAEAKLPEIRNNIQFLEDSVSDAKEILYSDINIKLTDDNIQNKKHLVEGVSHSFDSYVSCSYLLKLYKFVEIIYKDWERESYYKTFQYSLNNSKDLLDKGIYNYNELKEEFFKRLFPQEINTQYDLSLELYNNCNFKTIVTDKPTIGALFIASNNSNENDFDFVTSAVAHHSLNNNNYLKKLWGCPR